MLYRARESGKWITTSNLTELDKYDSVDIFILGIWQVYR